MNLQRAFFGPLAVAAGAALWLLPAAAAPGDYEHERALCLSGRTTQDQASCLREAAAARDDQRRGGAAEVESKALYQQNALQRCQPLPPDDRLACEARVRGEGRSSGSVAGGGILRELVVRDAPAVPSRPVTPVEVPSWSSPSSAPAPAQVDDSRKVTPVVVPDRPPPANR